jgi:hypothetical protein
MLNVDDIIKSCTNAVEIISKDVIQELWSGYGKIVRYNLDSPNYSSVVVKYIQLKPTRKHPKGWNTTNSHERKVKSYEVETNWYQFYGNQLSDKVRIPELIGLVKEGLETVLILEDLDSKGFSLRKQSATILEVKKCISWLASLHGETMLSKDLRLWDKGSYWHLSTRIYEYDAMEKSYLKEQSHKMDNILNKVVYKCLIHGDPKLSNFCFHDNDNDVAGLDFQYIGAGCGMKDLIYLIGSALSSDECFKHEQELINYYFSQLKQTVEDSIDFDSLEREWRPLFTIAWGDFNRFLMGWMPNHAKLNKYSDSITSRALEQLKQY